MFMLFLTFPNESSSVHRLNNELIKSTLTDLTRLSEGFSIVPGHMLVLVLKFGCSQKVYIKAVWLAQC